MVRSMMCRINLPRSFWSYALMTVARLVNLAPTKKVDKTPYEIWHESKPNLSYLRVWGCDAYVTSDSDDNLDPRGEKERTLSRGRSSKSRNGNNIMDLEEIQETQTTAEEVAASDQQEVVADELYINTSIRRSSRFRKEPNRYLWHLEASKVLLVAESNDEPTNYKSAISDPESEKWLEAMNAEMQSMRDNQVWDLIELPPVLGQ
ncbi:hypothetical protein L1987_53099 [Smallanthus sonchifolius]|uniref:Uncharacterized protein n=1 Tax=Smallanthus sonchifolius TaxID=185202 RepID=A0ACB9EUL9_9ASTR|nr:hypothetical protein L1987_53099 [Smallanthus sonchifolius]